MTSPYKPVSFTSEAVSQQKMQQLANNQQWMFENMPRMRYASSGLTRDAGIKMIAGKTYIPPLQRDWTEVETYFGSFFSAGCKPIVTAVAEMTSWKHRTVLAMRPLGDYRTYGEIDHRGFKVHVWSIDSSNIFWLDTGGFIHWQAVGY